MCIHNCQVRSYAKGHICIQNCRVLALGGTCAVSTAGACITCAVTSVRGHMCSLNCLVLASGNLCAVKLSGGCIRRHISSQNCRVFTGQEPAGASGGGAPGSVNKGAGQGSPRAAHSPPHKAHSALHTHHLQRCCCPQAAHLFAEVLLRAPLPHCKRLTPLLWPHPLSNGRLQIGLLVRLLQMGLLSTSSSLLLSPNHGHHCSREALLAGIFPSAIDC